MLRRIQRIGGWTFLALLLVWLPVVVPLNILLERPGVSGEEWWAKAWGLAVLVVFVGQAVSLGAFFYCWLIRKFRKSGPSYTTPVERK